MNQHEAKQWLPIIQALAEWKTIQRRNTVSITLASTREKTVIHYWGCVDSVNLSLIPENYRIKPEPREAYIPPEEFERYRLNHRPSIRDIKVREVLE